MTFVRCSGLLRHEQIGWFVSVLPDNSFAYSCTRLTLVCSDSFRKGQGLFLFVCRYGRVADRIFCSDNVELVRAAYAVTRWVIIIAAWTRVHGGYERRKTGGIF